MSANQFFDTILEDGAMGGGTPTNSVTGVAGIGAPSKDPSAPKNFAEPGVTRKKKPILTDKPMKRKLMTFEEFMSEKHDVRDVSGKMTKISKKPVRHPGGKITMEYPGKSSSSGGGD